jgi:hypothetical protein
MSLSGRLNGAVQWRLSGISTVDADVKPKDKTATARFAPMDVPSAAAKKDFIGGVVRCHVG